MTVTTPPPCTIEIPSVESEWVVGFITIGVYAFNNVYVDFKCVYRFFVGSPLLQFLLLSLFSAHSVIDGERNANVHRSSSSLT